MYVPITHNQQATTLAALTAMLILSASDAMAQTEHLVRARRVGVGGTEQQNVQATPPTPGSPQSAAILEQNPNWPGQDSYQVEAGIEAVAPMRATSTFATTVLADTGTDVAVSTETLYQALEWVTITRTDQPAAPGETVQVRMLPEFDLTVDATLQVGPNDATGTIGYAVRTRFAPGQGAGAIDITASLGDGNPLTFNTNPGWTTAPTPFRTIALDTPQLLSFWATVEAGGSVVTAPSQNGRLDAVFTADMRLPAEPFQFNGPGTYTITAAAMGIVNNSYPAILVDENTTQQQLDELVTVDGSIIIDGTPTLGCLSFNNLELVTGDVVVQGSAGYDACLDLSSATIEGNVTIETEGGVDLAVGQTNGVVDVIISDTGGGVTVGGITDGDIIIDDTTGGVTVGGGSVDGDILIDGTSGGVTVGGDVGGDILIDDVGGDIDIGGDVGNDIIINSPGKDLNIGTGAVGGDIIIDSAGGDLDIGGDVENDIIINSSGKDLNIGTGAVGGDIIINSTGGDLDIGGDVGGSVVVTSASNGFAGTPLPPVTITLNGASITGNVTLLGVGPTTLTVPGPLTVGGNLEADNLTAPIDLSTISVNGFTTVTATGSDSINATVAALDTTTTVSTATDVGTLTLPSTAEPQGAPLSIVRLGGPELTPEPGLLIDGSESLLKPYSRYAIDVGDNTLALPANLTLTINLDTLSPSQRNALGSAITDGSATIATADGGSLLASLPICVDETPAEGCTVLQLLDGNAAPTTFELATKAQFTTLTTNFSDWAVVIDAGDAAVPAVSTWGVAVLALLTLTTGSLLWTRERRVAGGN